MGHGWMMWNAKYCGSRLMTRTSPKPKPRREYVNDILLLYFVQYNRYRQLGTHIIWLVCRYLSRIRDGQVSRVLRVEFRTAMDADHTEHPAISGPRRIGETRTGLF